MIRLEGISKIYSTDIVLKEVNWDIKRGEKIGLVGSNGSGKTTQLKILYGDEEQTSGEVIKEGNPKIAYLKQEFDLNKSSTLQEELESTFDEIQLITLQLKDIERKMKSTKNFDQLEKLIDQLGIYQRKFEALGGYEMKAEVDKILPKLGFSSRDANTPIANFSGGWQMRIALGKIMLQKPDLILLDEPTNHLDLDTILWLEDYLRPLKISIILISHDRYFLDKLCNKVVFIEDGISHTFNGNYSFFLKQKSINDEIQIKKYEIQQKELKSQKEFIEKFRASATRSSQAKSREKQLHKIEKLASPEKMKKSPSFVFSECPRSSQSVLEISDLSHSYDDKIIFFEANLKISAGDKIGLLGPNGSGKSTLFKLIVNQLSPELGAISLGKTNLLMSYYEQNQADALELDQLVIEVLYKNVPNWSQEKVRTYLGNFGFYKDSVFKFVRQLSGGEKARLALALIILKPSNFLLLDEPTNHLDLQSKENLENALSVYNGTIFFISHDRYFISKVANKIVEINNYELKVFNGNYDYYLQKKKKN